MKAREVQGTEKVTNHEKLEHLPKRRCGVGQKCVGATCCVARNPITVTLRQSVCEDLDRAAYYITTLPQRIKEVQEAAEAVLEEGRRQGL
jgi:hypothetical protein